MNTDYLKAVCPHELVATLPQGTNFWSATELLWVNSSPWGPVWEGLYC